MKEIQFSRTAHHHHFFRDRRRGLSTTLTQSVMRIRDIEFRIIRPVHTRGRRYTVESSMTATSETLTWSSTYCSHHTVQCLMNLNNIIVVQCTVHQGSAIKRKNSGSEINDRWREEIYVLSTRCRSWSWLKHLYKDQYNDGNDFKFFIP